MERKIELDSDLNLEAKTEVYQSLTWNNIENAHRTRELTSEALSPNKQTTFSEVFMRRLENSPLGIFLRMPRDISAEDRKCVLSFLQKTGTYSEMICEDIFSVIESALLMSPSFSAADSFLFLTDLRLVDCGVSENQNHGITVLNLSSFFISTCRIDVKALLR